MVDKKRMEGREKKRKRKAISSFHILYALHTIKLKPTQRVKYQMQV